MQQSNKYTTSRTPELQPNPNLLFTVQNRNIRRQTHPSMRRRNHQSLRKGFNFLQTCQQLRQEDPAFYQGLALHPCENLSRVRALDLCLLKLARVQCRCGEF